jgi:hypothetical protein
MSAASLLVMREDDALREQLKRRLKILESDRLKNGYRSDSGASAVSEGTVTALQEYLRDQATNPRSMAQLDQIEHILYDYIK